MGWVNEREQTICQFVIVENKLMSVFNVSVLLLAMNFIIRLSKCCVDPLSYRLGDPKLLNGNVMTKFMINNRTDACKTNVNLLTWRNFSPQDIPTKRYFRWRAWKLVHGKCLVTKLQMSMLGKTVDMKKYLSTNTIKRSSVCQSWQKWWTFY